MKSVLLVIGLLFLIVIFAVAPLFEGRRLAKLQEMQVPFDQMTAEQLLAIPLYVDGFFVAPSDARKEEACNRAYWRKVREEMDWKFNIGDVVRFRTGSKQGIVSARYVRPCVINLHPHIEAYWDRPVRGQCSADENYDRRPLLESYAITFSDSYSVTHVGSHLELEE